MKRSHFLSPFLMPALVLAFLFQAACTNEMTLAVSTTTGKITVNPKKNDVLHFRHGSDGNLAIKFRLVSPCAEGMTVKDCTVNVSVNPMSVARYGYKCPPNVCADPEVIIGSDGDRGQLSFVNAGANPVPNETVDLACVGGQLQIDTEPDPLTAKPNDIIEWIPVGISGTDAPTVWSVDIPAGTCSMDRPINQGQGNGYCQFVGDPSKSIQFTVHSTTPACKDAMGKIN